MRRIIDFALGCFVAPGFIAATFLSYVKITSYLSRHFELKFIDFLQNTLDHFIVFIDFFYTYGFIKPIELAIFSTLYIFNLWGIELTITFPDWYPTAAYFSTLLYGSQVAAMKLFEPVAGADGGNRSGFSKDTNQWSTAVLGLIWNLILVIYIPVNSVSKVLYDYVNFENLSPRRVVRIFKIVLLGFLMVGYLFLIHDVIYLIINWRVKSNEVAAHKRFHLALILSVTVSTTASIISIAALSEH